MLLQLKLIRIAYFGRITLAKPRIKLFKSDTAPVSSAPYWAGPKTPKFEKAELDKMLAESAIEPAKTEWAALVLVLKKDEILWFWVDYRNLNAVTKRESYPKPRVEEWIDLLGKATIFSTLDANNKCWQIEIDDGNKAKTAFKSHHSLHCFARKPFKLRNAPCIFQHSMVVILSSFKRKFALVHLEDIVVFCKMPQQRSDHVRRLVSLLHSAGVSKQSIATNSL